MTKPYYPEKVPWTDKINHEDIVDARDVNQLYAEIEAMRQDMGPTTGNPIQSYDNVIHLPDNTTNGQVSTSVKGNTVVNLLGSSGEGNTLNGWATHQSNAEIVDDYIKVTGKHEGAHFSLISEYLFEEGKNYFVYALINNFSTPNGVKIAFGTNFGNVVVDNNWQYSMLKTKIDVDINLTLFAKLGSINSFGVKKVMAVEISEDEYNNMTEEELLQKYTYINGTKSTIGAMKIKSVGKNLFDGKLELGTIQNVSGENSNTDKSIRSKNFVKVKPNTQYYIFNNSDYNNFVYFYDASRNFTNMLPRVTLFTTNVDTHYIRFRTSVSNVENNPDTHFQLEKGDTATEYEPYKEDTSYVVAKDKDNKIVNLRSLPNGVADEIDLDEGILLKKINKLILEDGDIFDFTTATNRNNIFIKKPNDGIGFGNIKINWVTIDGFSEYTTEGVLPNEESSVDKFTTANILDAIRIGVPKSIDTLEKAKEYISGRKLTYQLAEPEIIPLDIKPVQAYENGTVIIEPYIKDTFTVDSSLSIRLQYPIEKLDKLLKLNTDTVKWEEVEGTLSEDGRNVTVSEIGTYQVFGEIREGESTNPLTTIIPNINLNGQVNSNTSSIMKLGNKIYDDSDLFTAMLLQQETRLTILEGGS